MDLDVAILTDIPAGVPREYSLKRIKRGLEFNVFLPLALRMVQKRNAHAVAGFYRREDLDATLPNSNVEEGYGQLRQKLHEKPSTVFSIIEPTWTPIGALFSRYGPDLDSALSHMAREMPLSVHAYLSKGVPQMGAAYLSAPVITAPISLDAALKITVPVELIAGHDPEIFFLNGIKNNPNPFIVNPTVYDMFRAGSESASRNFLQYLSNVA